MLDSARPLQSSYPELAARIHANTPERFLHAVAEAIKDGKGTPKVLNDEQIVPFYLANGATVEEALDYAGSGCIESRLVNRETQVTGNAAINYGSVIEMTLRDGRVKVWKDAQFGLHTGDPRAVHELRRGLERVLRTARADPAHYHDAAVRRARAEAAALRRAVRLDAARPRHEGVHGPAPSRRVHPGRHGPLLHRVDRQGHGRSTRWPRSST